MAPLDFHPRQKFVETEEGMIEYLNRRLEIQQQTAAKIFDEIESDESLTNEEKIAKFEQINVALDNSRINIAFNNDEKYSQYVKETERERSREEKIYDDKRKDAMDIFNEGLGPTAKIIVRDELTSGSPAAVYNKLVSYYTNNSYHAGIDMLNHFFEKDCYNPSVESLESFKERFYANVQRRASIGEVMGDLSKRKAFSLMLNKGSSYFKFTINICNHNNTPFNEFITKIEEQDAMLFHQARLRMYNNVNNKESANLTKSINNNKQNKNYKNEKTLKKNKIVNNEKFNKKKIKIKK